MNKAMVLPNPLKDEGFCAARALISALGREGFETLAAVHLRADLPDAEACGVRFLPEAEALEACDFLIVLGGDGSILHAAALAAPLKKPILGVNIGTLGFMTEIESHELDLLRDVKENNFTLDRRSMLDIFSVSSSGEQKFYACALNDAVIGNGPSAKPVRLSVAVDGERTLDFTGDGLIVSTPTGSTAYSLAAGGPVLAPSSPCIAVTPICPHSLSAKSLVVDDGSEIIVRSRDGHSTLFLSSDGREYHIIGANEHVKICKSAHAVELIRLKGIGFYERIRIKLAK